MRRPLKFDEISKFYWKLLSSVKKKSEFSSCFYILLRIYELYQKCFVDRNPM